MNHGNGNHGHPTKVDYYIPEGNIVSLDPFLTKSYFYPFKSEIVW